MKEYQSRIMNVNGLATDNQAITNEAKYWSYRYKDIAKSNFYQFDVCKLFFRLPYQDDMFWRFATGDRSYNMQILPPSGSVVMKNLQIKLAKN